MRGFNNSGAYLIIFYTVTVASGFLGFRIFDFAYGMPFLFGDNLVEKNFITTELIFLTAVISYFIGYIIFSQDYRILINSSTSPILSEEAIHNKKPNKLVMVILLTIPVFSLITSYGLGNILYRSEYIPEVIMWLKSISLLILPITLIYSYYARTNKYIIFIFYLIFFILLFGLGSRFMAVLPLCYLLSKVLFAKERLNLFKVFMAFVIAILSIMIAIQNRRYDLHGILPYAENIVRNGLDFSILLFAYNYISSFSYSLTAYLVDNIEYSIDYFFVSINPLPGFLIGWAEVAPLLRINKFAPYNAISELAAVNMAVLSAYYFFAGLFFGFTEKVLSKRKSYFRIVVIFFSLIFTFYSLQYNLRSTTRMLYYLAVITLFTESFFSLRTTLLRTFPKHN
jgi:hypothetical protein